MIKWPTENLKGSTYCVHIAANINEFGIKEPIVCLHDGTVVDGRKRLAAARSLGYAVVPIRLVEHLEPPVDPNVRLPIEFDLFSFIKVGTCKNRIYLKVTETMYLELQAGCDSILVAENHLDHQIFSKPESIDLHFKDKITHSETKVFDCGIKTQVVAQDRKPANHYKVNDIVRLHGGSHPYIIYSKSAEEIFLRSLVTGESKGYQVAESRLYTRQTVARSDIL